MFQNNSEDVAKQKLLLLYILETTPIPLTREQFTELLIDNFNINFFIIQQYLSELVEGSFISVDELDPENSILNLENAGKESLNYFKSKISNKTIRKIHCILNVDVDGIKIPVQSKADSYPRDNGEINVNLKLIENNETVFSMYISVPNQEQAFILMDKWNQSPEYYFKSIIDLFINNKPAI